MATFPVRADEFDPLRQYWWTTLTGGSNNSASTLTSRANSANTYWTSLNTNAGRTYLWSDLPLGSKSANISSTFNRLKTMALAWTSPGCSLAGNTNLAAAINSGLDWMATNIYSPTIATGSQYDNWWDWQIGGPQAFNDTVVMMYASLTGTQITSYNNSIDHYSPPTKALLTGANLTDQCKVVLIRGIYGKNSGRMSYGQTNLSPVFPYVTSGDGFYRDGSFIQHTKFGYTGSYGLVLLADVAQLLTLLDGSTWQITDPGVTNVFNWVSDSFEPLIYNGEMMDMVRGRAISRVSTTQASNASGAINNIRQIATFAPPATAAAFTNWANSPVMPPSQYHFADMDRAVAWRSNFCFGLSMMSSRIANYESINGENLHGWFTGDGMTYLYLGNPESQFAGDFWPTVDPYHLPGTTVAITNRADGSGQGALSTQNWVGGAQVAKRYGVAGMSLASYGTSLTAKKSWFMFDNEVLCLGAGITCGGTNEVHTTVEDRRLGITPTNNFQVNGLSYPSAVGWSSNLTSASWCSLAGVAGYYFPGGATNLQDTLELRAHAWAEINNGTYVASTTNLSTNTYLKLWFNHGVKPTNYTYAYVILPNVTANGLTNYAAAPDIVVLTNTATVQAAGKPALGLVAANFWTDGTNSADLITVNKKSSVITLESSTGIAVGVADPTQTNTSTIKVTLNRAALGTLSADTGVTVLQLSPQIIFTVNVSGSLGKTYQVAFFYPAPTLSWDVNLAAAGAQDGSGVWNGSNTNWWNGSGNVAWNDAAPGMAAFGAGGAAGIVSLANAHTVFALIFNPVTSSNYTLNGTDTLTVSNGLTANTSATINVPLNLGMDQVWTVASNLTLNVNGTISASGPVVLSLVGAGTVNLGGTNQISTNIGSLNFVDTQNRTTLAISAGAQTIGAMSLSDGVTNRMTGGGSLFVNAAADLRVGGETTGAAQMLEMSGLNRFSYIAPANTFAVGGQSSGVGGSGTVYLAATSSITANVVGVQNVVGATSAQSSGSLYLGRSTTINANTLNVGLTRDNGAIQFAATQTNPVVVIRATDGLGRANVIVGTRSSSYFTTTTALVDLNSNVSGASFLDALIGTLQIANEGYCLTASDILNGSFLMSGGSLDATAIIVGAKSSSVSQSLGNVNGTFTQGGGAVKVGTLTLGDRTTGNTNTLNASYNLNGGTLNAQTIAPGANAATRNFNWNNGSIGSYDDATDLTIAAGLNVNLSPASAGTFTIGNGRVATVNAIIAGAGAIVKSGGNGTLILAATNTYTGPTTVNSGALLVNGALGTNSVTVAANAAVGGAGRINGVTTVQAGGAIQAGDVAGAGTLTIGTLNLGNGPSAATTSRFIIAAGGKIAVTSLNINGTNTISILDGSLAVGTNTLFTYTGVIGGSGFAGFKLGALPTLPAGTTAYLQINSLAVQLVVMSLAVPVLVGTATYVTGTLSFSFTGVNGQPYRVVTSSDLALPLADWPTVADGIFGSGGVNFSDPAATNAQQYYRIVSP